MMATEKAGSNSDRTSDGCGSASSGNERGIAEMSPTVGTAAKYGGRGQRRQVSNSQQHGRHGNGDDEGEPPQRLEPQQQHDQPQRHRRR